MSVINKTSDSRISYTLVITNRIAIRKQYLQIIEGQQYTSWSYSHFSGAMVIMKGTSWEDLTQIAEDRDL
jgi:hypothetical protein